MSIGSSSSRERTRDDGVISSAVLAGSTRPITGVIVHGLGESLGGAGRPSSVRPPYTYTPRTRMHIMEIDATSVTSISIAEIFMAINRRTWLRSVNYVRRSTDYDAAALFARDISSSGRTSCDLFVEKLKGNEIRLFLVLKLLGCSESSCRKRFKFKDLNVY